MATLADAIIKGAASTGAVVKPYTIRCHLWSSYLIRPSYRTGLCVLRPVRRDHGGQETTALTTLPFFAHLAYLPIGYTNQTISALDQVQGGPPYGASTIVGADGSRQPLPAELEATEWQGKY
ncbi:hypothetical protein IAT38_007778 [Cryptococcus sp. DSM 104549]